MFINFEQVKNNEAIRAYIRMADIQRFRRLNPDSRLVIIPGTSHTFQEAGAWDMVLDLTRDWFDFQQVLLDGWT